MGKLELRKRIKKAGIRAREVLSLEFYAICHASPS